MGTIVQFPPRQEAEMASAESILAKLAEAYRRRTKAKEELPVLLAALIDAGETQLVLRAIQLWGRGELEPEDVFDLCQEAIGQGN